MTRGVSAGINAVIGKVLPEQRLFAKTDQRTRFLRLSPLTQLTGIVSLAALMAWTGYIVSEHVSGDDQGAQLVEADQSLVEIYELRVARLEEDKRRLADRLSSSQAEVAFAADKAAQTHQSLGSALTSSRMMKASEASHLTQLDELSKLQVATSERCDGLDFELTTATAAQTEMAQQLQASDAALADLATALEETADIRDHAQSAASRLSFQVASLQAEYDLRRDQQNRLMSRLEDAARLSLGSLDTVFSKTGVDLDKVLAEVKRDYSGSGGLFIPIEADIGFDQPNDDGDDTNRVKTLLSDMERINSMRIAIDRLPFLRPVGPARFSSGYGPRKDPKNGRKAFHGGIDFAAPRGTAIYATGDGEVVFSARQRGYGNLIKIRHAFGYETVYAHLNRRRVQVGDKVKRGDRIGDMGNTGRSTGTHLHYEIRVNGNTINPAKYIEAARNVL